MHIKRLIIKGYRCYETFTWDPYPGVNCLIGPGDIGKSTVLAAISTLLAPFPLQHASEFDYHRRRVSEGFTIEAFIAGFDETIATEGIVPALKGWQNNNPVPLPEDGAIPVLHCCVRGTPDLELIHEILTAGDAPQQFKVGLRKQLLLTRLGGEERTSRDLRLGNGTLLNEFLEPARLRASIHAAVTTASANLCLPTELIANLEKLGTRFGEEGLPKDLHLGLFPQQGNASTAMVALFTGVKREEAIPLAYSGAGTRQLAVLSLSTAELGQHPIITVDEPERGLEPYRQKALTAKIVKAVGADGQAFFTTHAPAVLAAMPEGAVWLMRTTTQSPGALPPPLAKILQRDPEALFAPQPVLCEGPTEIGFLRAVLPAMFSCDLDVLGIRLIDGRGQPQIFESIRAFHEAGWACAGFLDNEDEHKGRRKTASEQCRLFVWKDVKNLEEAIAKSLPLERFDALRLTAAGSQQRAKSFEDQICAGLPLTADEKRPSLAELVGAHGEPAVRQAIRTAMNDNEWLKSERIAYTVGKQIFKDGLPDLIKNAVQEFGTKLGLRNDEAGTNAASTTVG